MASHTWPLISEVSSGNREGSGLSGGSMLHTAPTGLPSLAIFLSVIRTDCQRCMSRFVQVLIRCESHLKDGDLEVA